MQGRVAAAFGDALEAPPQRLVAAWPLEQPSRERPVIKARAANDNGQPAARGNATDHRGGVARVARSRVLLRGIDDVGTLSVPMSKPR